MIERRIGVHLSIAGGYDKAAEHAHEIGANTFQVFSSSPRMWRASSIEPEEAEKLKQACRKYDCHPVVVHVSYLVNVCSHSEDVRHKSIKAFRGEVERALTLGARDLVLHPGSWKGLTREKGLALAVESISKAVDDIDFSGTDFQILIENTAGSEFSLGGSFEQVAELVSRLEGIAPVGVCLDTCHSHVAGYDLVSAEGYDETMTQIKRTIGIRTVRVWHMNDAEAPRDSNLDRHEHIGKGTMGLEPFRRLVNDRRFARCAFIAETPVDENGDEASNVATLRDLVGS